LDGSRALDESRHDMKDQHQPVYDLFNLAVYNNDTDETFQMSSYRSGALILQFRLCVWKFTLHISFNRYVGITEFYHIVWRLIATVVQIPVIHGFRWNNQSFIIYVTMAFQILL